MKIIMDSTSDLPENLIKQFDITIVPLTIHLGDKSWKDFYDIDPDTYYEMLKKTQAFPKTSQPSPQDFIDAYAPYVEKGEPILSLHISSKLSGTYQSALLAKNHFPQEKIEVIDSKHASMALALMILTCIEKEKKGEDFFEIAEFAKKLGDSLNTYFSVGSLEYLRRGGRIGRAQALLGSLMKIKPLLKLIDGEIHPVEKIRTTERLLDRFIDIIKEAAFKKGKIKLAAAESDNSDLMSSLLERAIKIDGVSLVYRGKIGGVVTSHAGPGTLGITFL